MKSSLNSYIQNYIKTYRLPILSGFLIGTSYIPFPPWALFFCLVPLFLFWWQRPTLKQAFIGGWTTQFILNLIGFHWIAYTAKEFGHIPWPLAFVVLLLFCSFAHLYYAFAGAMWLSLTAKIKLPSFVQVLLLCGLFSLLEYTFPKIFPWHMGYPWLWARLPGAQSADIWGFDGLAFLSVLFNGLIFWSFLRRKSQTECRCPWWTAGAVAAGMFVLVNIVGFVRQQEWNHFDKDAKFLMVQGNIGNLEKIQAEKAAGFQTFIVDTYISMSRRGLTEFPDSDFIVWPETAFPGYLDVHHQHEYYPQMVFSFVNEARRPLFTGSYSVDSKRSVYNGFFLIHPENTPLIQPYRKTILLAFGEYFPGSQYLPRFVKDLYPMSDFNRGSGPTAFPGDIKFGPQICYEGLYPWFSAEAAAKGAEIFINVTNDSWFGTYFEPYQHLYMTFARAIEVRRPLVRATNTGITTGILANGKILESSPQNQPWYGQLKVPFRVDPPHTFFEKIANYWGYALALYCVLLLGFSLRRKAVKP